MITNQLKISHVNGQIGIKPNDAVLSIQQPHAELEIKTTPTDLNIKTNHVRIKIDQSQCFSEVGLKDVFELTEEYARLGKEAAMEAIGNIVDEGNRMAMIQNKADAFAELDFDKAFPPPVDVNIALLPISRPKIDFEGGVYFNPQLGKADIKFQANRPEISASWPSLDIYLLQKPELNIEYVGNNVDIRK